MRKIWRETVILANLVQHYIWWETRPNS